MQNISNIIHYFIVVFVIIGSNLLITRSEDNFYFNPKPQDKNVNEGKRVVIECGVSNSDHISIHWNHNNNKIIYDSRRYQENGNLVILFADRDADLGQFTCVATNVTSGYSIQYTIELKVYWISEVVNVDLITPKVMSPTLNESEIILNCDAYGNPEPKSEWFHNGIKLHRSEHLIIRHKKLHISKILVTDNGVYSCRAINNAGKVDSIENFELKIKSEGVPYLEEISKYLIAKVNETITFNCSYTNAASIEWYAPNKDVPLINNSRFSVFPNGSLTISNIEKDDIGFYRCVAIPLIKDYSTQTYSTRLQIAFLEDFDANHFGSSFASNLQMHVVPKNSPNFELFCIPPNGLPKPKLWWEDPNGSVISDTGRVRVDENKLVIEGPVKKSDAGKYTCVAENMVGQTRKVSELYVAIAPTVSDPHSIVVEEDGVAVLHCLFSASPYTSVKWIKDGKYLRTSPHYSSPSNGSLIIKSAQISDSGKYECEINSTGFQPIRSKEATLTIREKLKFFNIPTNKNLELMSNAKLVCKARGAVPAIVKWVKWTKEGIDYEWPPHIHDSNGTLHFNGVKRQDSGNYTCIATNSQGIINTSIEVSVIVMPKFTVLPKSESEAMEGYSTSLHCRAEGEPNPTIQWDKDNILNGFDHQRFTVMPNGTLEINELHIEDTGKYGCTAGNSGGFKRTEVTLTVNSAENYSFNHLGVNSEENNSKMTRTVTITLGAAALYMFLVMALMVYCRYRRAKRKAASLVETTEADKPENGDLEMKERNNCAANPEHHRLLPTIDDKQRQICSKNSISVRNEGDVHSQTSSSHSSKRSKSPYEKLQISRQELQTICLLGHGEFGDVFLAKSNSNRNIEVGQIVMVKALQTKDENIHLDYRREIEMFHKMNHERIVRLIGLCRETDPFLVILEYSDWGDLKQFLLATRDDNMRRGPKPTALTFPQVIGISQQIAFGMEYLTSNRFVHKDLATRNCLITSKLDIKISSTSLSKDTYSVEYFNYQNRDIPIRWAPHEAVIEDEWSAKSDVYSFAVLIWEICSQAELPFYDKPDSAIVRLLQKNELKLDPPKAIPNLLRDLLITCWSTSPKDRPTFTDVCHNLNQVLLNIHI